MSDSPNYRRDRLPDACDQDMIRLATYWYELDSFSLRFLFALRMNSTMCDFGRYADVDLDAPASKLGIPMISCAVVSPRPAVLVYYSNILFL